MTTTATEMTTTADSTETTTGMTLPKASLLTRTRAFKRLLKWSFGVCDHDKTGEIEKTELYAGVLLVHVNLAKYAGPAACFPPDRDAVNALFEASDADNSGTIDEEEFETILQVCCGQILSRLLTYYAILILFVPWLAAKIVDYWGIKEDTYYEMAAEQMTSMTIFFFIVPQVWNYIDAQSRDVATKQSVEVKKLKIKKSLEEKLAHKSE